jgi:hypothetical protein
MHLAVNPTFQFLPTPSAAIDNFLGGEEHPAMHQSYNGHAFAH